MDYLSKKRSKRGRCNVCGRERRLTWDHVPPQGLTSVGAVRIQSALNNLIPDESPPKYRKAPNGVRYRTVCGDCNSSIGDKLDSALIDLSTDLSHMLCSDLSLPRVLQISTRPNAISRAILAHLLAATSTFRGAKFDEEIRSFVLDFSRPIPRSISIFYWLYPYENTVIMRDFAIPRIRGGLFGKFAYCNLLKYFPVGFLVMSECDEYAGLRSLNQYRSSDYDTVGTMRFDRTEILPPSWPEDVSGNNVSILSPESSRGIHAIPVKKGIRRRSW